MTVRWLSLLFHKVVDAVIQLSLYSCTAVYTRVRRVRMRVRLARWALGAAGALLKLLRNGTQQMTRRVRHPPRPPSPPAPPGRPPVLCQTTASLFVCNKHPPRFLFLLPKQAVLCMHAQDCWMLPPSWRAEQGSAAAGDAQRTQQHDKQHDQQHAQQHDQQHDQNVHQHMRARRY